MSITKEIDSTLKSLLNQIIDASVLIKPGSDNGVIPIHSLISDLLNSSENPTFKDSCANLKKELEHLLDTASPVDDDTSAYLDNFIEWASDSVSLLNENASIDLFPPLASPSNLISSTPTSYNIEIKAKNHDELIVLNIEEDHELLSEFVTESLEHLESVEGSLLSLEDNPLSEEPLNNIFRAFHSIKGVAGFLNIKPIQGLSHEIESLLDLARKNKLVLDSKLITIIFQSRDTINLCLNQIVNALEKNQLPAEIITVSNLITQINYLAAEYTSKKERNEPISEIHDNSTTTEESIHQPSSTQNTSIRINIDKMDNLMDTIGELSILKNQLQEGYENRFDTTAFQENLQRLSNITRDLQQNSMSLRMMPIKPTFQKISRVARDLAKSLGKKINFKVSGDETELDRTVIEQISDPLVHMIRNSIDHGIETPDERIKAHKKSVGLIQLKAYHSEGNIILELSDDGQGIDNEKVLNRAIQVGILLEDQVLTESEIQSLIFYPGFSTSQEITDVSGRGVGMDVVKRNIETLHGKIDISSKKGTGTVFKIKLPLTLAVIDGLLLQVENEKFILPTVAVKNVIPYNINKITTIQEKNEVLNWQNKLIPLLRLNDYLKIPTNLNKTDQGIIIIMESFDKVIGVFADEMVSKREFVIKNLGRFLKNLHGFSGGTILGDGSVALILDPSSLTSN